MKELLSGEREAGSIRVRVLKKLSDSTAPPSANIIALPPKAGLELSEEEMQHVLRLRGMSAAARDMLLALGESHVVEFPREPVPARPTLLLVARGQ